MNARKKPKMVSMRMSDDQFQQINYMISTIEAETGTKVTKSSLILKLMEFGYPTLKQKYSEAFSDKDVEDSSLNDTKKGLFSFLSKD